MGEDTGMRQAVNDLTLTTGLMISMLVTAYVAFSMFLQQVVVPVTAKAMAAGGLPGIR